MPGEPFYDPDSTVPADLDLTDRDVGSAYLDDPTTAALEADLGRLVRSMPAAEKREALEMRISSLEARRAQSAADLENSNPDAPARVFLEQYIPAMDGQIATTRLRLLELD